MLSDAFNNTLREFLAPKGVAKWPFDPSSGLLIPQGGSFKDLGTPEIQNLPDFGFKLHPTEANYFGNPNFGWRTELWGEHFRTARAKPTVGSV